MAPPPARRARRHAPSYAGAPGAARAAGPKRASGVPAVGERALLGRALDQLLVDLDIVPHHALDREAPQESRADGAAIELLDAAEGGHGAGHILDVEAGDALIDHFRDRAAAE